MEQRTEGLSPVAKEPREPREPRLRRKLQKTITRQRSKSPSRFRSGASNQSSPRRSNTTNSMPATPALPSRPQGHFPRPSDPEIIRRNGGFYEPDSPTEPPDLFDNPRTPPEPRGRSSNPRIVPELSHLVTSNSSQSSSSPAPSTPRMRRRAKTPILSIGQLEAIKRPTKALERTSSVDLIADQYQAVLECRRCSVYTDAYSEQPPSPQIGEHVKETDEAEADEPRTLSRRRSSANLRDEMPTSAPRALFDLPACSPASDDGTLVSFDGDGTVYFKPLSVPEERPPAVDRQESTNGNVSLQICLDLLTRELSSAFVGRPSRSSLSTSALQVWVMIEAYEKLRDQLAETRHEKLKPVGAMFDMWLGALYSIHDSMMGCGEKGVSDIGAELGTEELD